MPWHRELCNRLERATAILVVICIIAGWSERLLPSLIKQLEGTLVRNVEEVEFVEADGGAEGGRDEPGKPKRMLRSFLLRRKE